MVTFGASVTYTCRVGYSADPNNQALTEYDGKCTKDGSITADRDCAPVVCGAAPEVANAEVCALGSSFIQRSAAVVQGKLLLKAKRAKVVQNASKRPGSRGHCQPPSGDIAYTGPSIEARCNAFHTINGVSGGSTTAPLMCQADGEFAELEGQCESPRFIVKGVVTDSQSNYIKLSDADIKFKNTAGSLVEEVKTDWSGKYTAQLPSGAIKVIVSKEGYINGEFDLVIESDINVGNGADFPLSKKLPPGQWRIVLRWEGLEGNTRYPTDLDSHTYLASWGSGTQIQYGTQAYYGRRHASDSWYNTGITASLDTDVTNGYGPETTTLTGIGECTKAKEHCRVKFMVKNWAMNGALGEARASVTVYAGSTVLADYKIPQSVGNPRTYDVFNIDASTGELFVGEKKLVPSLHEDDKSQEPSWRSSFDSEQWSKVPTTGVIYGITASKFGPIHVIESGHYYPIRNAGAVTCSDHPWNFVLEGVWGQCPEGFYLNGLFRTGYKAHSGVGKITQARCCKSDRLDAKWGKCTKVASFTAEPEAICPLIDVNGLATPSAMVAIHRSSTLSGDEIRALNKIECCTFPEE
jgi:hypothetical protein